MCAVWCRNSLVFVVFFRVNREKSIGVLSTCAAYLFAVAGNYLAIWPRMLGLICVLLEQKKVLNSARVPFDLLNMQTKHNDTDFHFH